MNQVILSLGSNIRPAHNLPAAVALLRTWAGPGVVRVVGVAPVYETAPVGLLDQPAFWNTAVLIETDLDAASIKNGVIDAIEQRLHRVRQADKNAPRTIDLDITLYQDAVFSFDPGDGRRRPVPDPDLLRFPHVAVPVAAVAPGWRHPETGELLADIAARLAAAAAAAGNPPLRPLPEVVL